MRYIEDLKEGETITEHYLCKQKQTLKSKSGKSYLSLKLFDRTGEIDAKVWDLNNNIQSFEENDFIKIEALVTLYQNDPQLKVYKIRKSAAGEYDENNYIPATDKDINVLFSQITEYIKSVANPYVRRLLEDILINNADIKGLFLKNSAAKKLHHGVMGGLLEHTISVADICNFLSPRYKYVNRDILIAAALLHDIGKVYELSSFPENDYTDDGQLLGHIVMGAEIVETTASNIPGFPHQLKSLIKHCIVSHHGEYEYGSPKRPKIIEAFILYCADNMDAKIKMFEEAIQQDNNSRSWIGYNKILSRNVRKSSFDNE